MSDTKLLRRVQVMISPEAGAALDSMRRDNRETLTRAVEESILDRFRRQPKEPTSAAHGDPAREEVGPHQDQCERCGLSATHDHNEEGMPKDCRTFVNEVTLECGLGGRGLPVIASERSSFNDPARAIYEYDQRIAAREQEAEGAPPARAVRKQARKERKAAPAQSVVGAVKAKPEPVLTKALDTLLPTDQATCIHPSNRRTPGSEPKCIDCGKRLKAGVWV